MNGDEYQQSFELPALGDLTDGDYYGTNERYACNVCQRSFESSTELTLHHREHREEFVSEENKNRNKLFKCTLCPKFFNQASRLSAHYLSVHIDVDRSCYECVVCPKSFKTASRLSMHYVSVHIEHKCDLCPKSFKQATKLKRHHRLVHSNDRPYKCDTCEKTYKQACNLKRHHLLSQCNNWPYSCDVQLAHYSPIHIDVDRSCYECGVCPMSFKTAACFHRHSEVHNNVCPYKCDVCQKLFKSASDLRMHLVLHDNNHLHGFSRPRTIEGVGNDPRNGCLINNEPAISIIRGMESYSCHSITTSSTDLIEVAQDSLIYNNDRLHGFSNPRTIEGVGNDQRNGYLINNELANSIYYGMESYNSCNSITTLSTDPIEVAQDSLIYNNDRLHGFSKPRTIEGVGNDQRNGYLINNELANSIYYGMESYNSCNSITTFSTDPIEVAQNSLIYNNDRLHGFSKPRRIEGVGNDQRNGCLINNEPAISIYRGMESYNSCNSITTSSTDPIEVAQNSVIHDNDRLHGFHNGVNITEDGCTQERNACEISKEPTKNHKNTEIYQVLNVDVDPIRVMQREDMNRKNNEFQSDAYQQPEQVTSLKKSFDGDFNLKLHHLTANHPYKCNICQKSFKLASSLHHHSVVHKKDRPYKCNICQKSFKRLSCLQKHSVVHNTDRPLYSCGVCQKSFKIACSFRKHSKLHTNSPNSFLDRINNTVKGATTEQTNDSQINKEFLVTIDHRSAENCVINYIANSDFESIEVVDNEEERLISNEKNNEKEEASICQKSFKLASCLQSRSIAHNRNRKHISMENCTSTHISDSDVHSIKVVDNKRENLIENGKKNEKQRKSKVVAKLNIQRIISESSTVPANDRPYACRVCQKTFKLASFLQRHKSAVHNIHRPVYKCDVCQESFKVAYSLNLHAAAHHNDRLDSFRTNAMEGDNTEQTGCRISNEVTARKQRSMENCTSQKIPDSDVDLCQKSFKQASKLKRHHRLVHSNDRPYKCDICEKTYKQACDIKGHHLLSQCNNWPYSCDVQLASSLHHHYVLHKKDRPYKCNICQKSFKRVSCLQKHSVVHNKDRHLYSCGVCQKSFKLSPSLQRHLHRDHPTFSCGICQKSFNKISILGKHLELHNDDQPFFLNTRRVGTMQAENNVKLNGCHTSTKSVTREHRRLENYTFQKNPNIDVDSSEVMECEPDSPTVNGKNDEIQSKSDVSPNSVNSKQARLLTNDHHLYKCDACQKTFRHARCLKIHCLKMIAKSAKPYTCDICQETFKQATKHKRHHLMVHNNDKPYICDVCQISFKKASYLRQHDVVHMNDDDQQHSVAHMNDDDQQYSVVNMNDNDQQDSVEHMNDNDQQDSVEHMNDNDQQHSVVNMNDNDQQDSVEHMNDNDQQDSVEHMNDNDQQHSVVHMNDNDQQDSVVHMNDNDQQHSVEHMNDNDQQDSVEHMNDNDQQYSVVNMNDNDQQDSVEHMNDNDQQDSVEHMNDNDQQHSVVHMNDNDQQDSVEHMNDNDQQDSVEHMNDDDQQNSMVHMNDDDQQHSVVHMNDDDQQHSVVHMNDYDKQETVDVPSSVTSNWQTKSTCTRENYGCEEEEESVASICSNDFTTSPEIDSQKIRQWLDAFCNFEI